MANDAFALSPISARATQPSEQDYDAISEAFMETARGRWFLGEYAKRNRNADTRMVLDAVERIEQTIAAQKIPEPEPVPDTSLADALTAIKTALSEARTAAGIAVDDLALSAQMAPVRKGTRVIREISWRWREIGADSRICDLIDSQVSAIEASCAQISSADPHPGLSAAFDLIDRTIAAFDETADAPPQAFAEADAPASPVVLDDMTAVADEETVSSVDEAEAIARGEEPSIATPSAATMSAEPEQPVAVADAVDDAPVETSTSIDKAIEIAIAATASETLDETVAELTPDTADADDEAMLDMVAAEMGAPDLSDDGEYYSAALAEMEAAEAAAAEMQASEIQSAEIRSAELGSAPPAAEPPIETTSLAPRAATPLPNVYPALQPSLDGPETSLAPTPEPSLGSALIANGLVSLPKPASDPLAALRRLSQVEKIALFS